MSTKKSSSTKAKKTTRTTKKPQQRSAQVEAAPSPVTPPSEQLPVSEPAVAGAAKKKQPASKSPKAKKPKKAKRVSALDAAAQVIANSAKPMRPTEMIEQMEAKGLWKSPGGKTPAATLYAGIVREIVAKGTAARFRKHDRGLFVAGKGS